MSIGYSGRKCRVICIAKMSFSSKNIYFLLLAWILNGFFFCLKCCFFCRPRFTGKMKWLQFQYEVVFGDSLTGGAEFEGLFKLVFGIGAHAQICKISCNFTLFLHDPFCLFLSNDTLTGVGC